jgi:hypothetical protein
VGGVYTSDEAESARMGQGMGYKKVLKYVQLDLSVLVYLWCSQAAMMMHDLTLLQVKLLRKDDSRTIISVITGVPSLFLFGLISIIQKAQAIVLCPDGF